MAGDAPGLVGAADLAAFLGNDQAQVHSEPAVGGPRVRPHVRSGVHDRVFDLRRKQNKLVIHLWRGRGSAPLKGQDKIHVHLNLDLC